MSFDCVELINRIRDPVVERPFGMWNIGSCTSSIVLCPVYRWFTPDGPKKGFIL